MPAFLLPDLGEGLTEAEIVTWRVEAGDVVAVDQTVVEGREPLMVSVHRAADIRHVLDLAREQNLKLILEGAEEGWRVEVIDLRSLSPFDDETVTASVRRTGRAVVVHEASGFCGYGAEVAARLSEQCFHYLQAPVLRVTGLDIPYPPPHLEQHHLPSVDRILDAIGRLQWCETAAMKADG